MNSIETIYKYGFRGLGWVLIAFAATGIIMMLSSCTDRRRTESVRTAEGQILKQYHGDFSAEMLKYRLTTKKHPPLQIQKEKAR